MSSVLTSPPVQPAADGRRRRGDVSRRAILDAATRAIAERGPGALTHRSVAAAADLSPARVSYHFPTVDDLMVSAATEYLQAFDDRLRSKAEAARAGERSMVDVCTDVLYELVTEEAGAFLAMVEVRLVLARRGRTVDDTGIVSVIRSFGASEPRAGAIAAAMFGFAVLAASGPRPPDRDAVRSHVLAVLGVES